MDLPIDISLGIFSGLIQFFLCTFFMVCSIFCAEFLALSFRNNPVYWPALGLCFVLFSVLFKKGYF